MARTVNEDDMADRDDILAKLLKASAISCWLAPSRSDSVDSRSNCGTDSPMRLNSWVARLVIR